MDQFYVQGKSAPSAKLCAASIALKFSNIFMNSFQMKLKGAFASIFLVQVLHWNSLIFSYLDWMFACREEL